VISLSEVQSLGWSFQKGLLFVIHSAKRKEKVQLEGVLAIWDTESNKEFK